MPARKKNQPHSNTPEYHRMWRKKNLSNRKSSLKWRKDHPARQIILRSKVRARGHGGLPITDSEEEVLNFVEAKPGKCGICGRPETRTHFLVLDHDHSTGHVRGWLCAFCNMSIHLIDKHFDRTMAWRKRGAR